MCRGDFWGFVADEHDRAPGENLEYRAAFECVYRWDFLCALHVVLDWRDCEFDEYEHVSFGRGLVSRTGPPRQNIPAGTASTRRYVCVSVCLSMWVYVCVNVHGWVYVRGHSQKSAVW